MPRAAPSRSEMDRNAEHLFSAKFACPVCSYALQELEPRLFSFNNPMGACPKCDGFGVIQFFDPKRVVAHPDLSLAAGAIRGWDTAQPVLFPDARIARRPLTASDIDTPWANCRTISSNWCCTAPARERSTSAT